MISYDTNLLNKGINKELQEQMNDKTTTNSLPPPQGKSFPYFIDLHFVF